MLINFIFNWNLINFTKISNISASIKFIFIISKDIDHSTNKFSLSKLSMKNLSINLVKHIIKSEGRFSRNHQNRFIPLNISTFYYNKYFY